MKSRYHTIDFNLFADVYSYAGGKKVKHEKTKIVNNLLSIAGVLGFKAVTK